MKIRTIENGKSKYFILDEYMPQDRINSDILAMRELDCCIVIAHGWNEAKGVWDYGDYYGNSSEALRKAINDFGAIRDAYTELEASDNLVTYEHYIDPRDAKEAINFVKAVAIDYDTGHLEEIYNLKLHLIKEYFNSSSEYEYYTGGTGLPSKLYMETMAHEFEFDVKCFNDYIDELNQQITKNYRPIVRIQPGTDRNLFISQLDEESWKNIEHAIRDREKMKGHYGGKLEKLVAKAMSNRLSAIEESLTVIEELAEVSNKQKKHKNEGKHNGDRQ